MDDMTLVALGRTFITDVIEREKMLRTILELQQKLADATKAEPPKE